MEQHEAFEKIREARAKSDLIGTIRNSEVYELLGFHKTSTIREKEAWAAFMEELGKMAEGVSVKKRDNLECMAQNFGNEREETGFRIGFHVAMRLCMEGLNGGVGL